ncbi:MAG: hypothetical protein AB7O39_08990 [Flavobacteriaceae bacterium]
MNMGTHPGNNKYTATPSRHADGFDRLIEHYDDQLSPLFGSYNVLSDLRRAVDALRQEGLETEGPALSQFALAWRNASRLLTLAAIRRRPCNVIVH